MNTNNPSSLEEMIQKILIQQTGLKVMRPEEVVYYYNHLRQHILNVSSITMVENTPSLSVADAKSPHLDYDSIRTSGGSVKKIPTIKNIIGDILETSIDQVKLEGRRDTKGHRSLFADPDEVTCLECGNQLKMLTVRHLKKHGMTPDEYKTKWEIDQEVSLTAKNLRKKLPEEGTMDTHPQQERGEGSKRILVSARPTLPINTEQKEQPSYLSKEKSLANPAVAAAVKTIQSKVIDFEGKYDGIPEEDLIGIKSLTFDNEQICCLECGTYLKMITVPHLKAHGLTREQYAEKWDIPPKMSLVCKKMLDEKRENFIENKIWTTRKGKGN